MKIRNKIKISIFGLLTMFSLSVFGDSPAPNPYEIVNCAISPWGVTGGDLTFHMSGDQSSYGTALIELSIQNGSGKNQETFDGNWKSELISNSKWPHNILNGFLRITFEGSSITSRPGKNKSNLTVTLVTNFEGEFLHGDAEIIAIESGVTRRLYFESCTLE